MVTKLAKPFIWVNDEGARVLAVSASNDLTNALAARFDKVVLQLATLLNAALPE
jgi:hypothetical protein